MIILVSVCVCLCAKFVDGCTFISYLIEQFILNIIPFVFPVFSSSSFIHCIIIFSHLILRERERIGSGMQGSARLTPTIHDALITSARALPEDDLHRGMDA